MNHYPKRQKRKELGTYSKGEYPLVIPVLHFFHRHQTQQFDEHQYPILNQIHEEMSK